MQQHTPHWHSTTAHTLCHYSTDLLTCHLYTRPCKFRLWVQILLIFKSIMSFVISTTSLHNQRFIAVTVISVKFSLSSFSSSFLSVSGWLHRYLVQSRHIKSAQLFCSCVFTGMPPFLL